MPVELVFARQERPVGLSTLEQVRALRDEAQEAASTAATNAVEAAGPAIAEAIQGAAEAAAPAAAEAAAPAAAAAIRAEVAADADRAVAAADNAAAEAAPIAAEAVRVDLTNAVASQANRAEAARDDASAVAGIREFRDLPTLLANTTLTYGPGAAQVQAGDIIRTRAEGFSYRVLPLGATPHVTAGGVLLEVLPFNGSHYPWAAWAPVSDGVTDNFAKLRSAGDACRLNNISGLSLPAGRYFIGQEFIVDWQATIHGAGGTSYANDFACTNLYFPAGVNGIRIARAATAPSGKLGDWSRISKVALKCIGPNINSVGHGLVFDARAYLDDVSVDGFAVDGFHIEATATATPSRNANNFRLTNCRSVNNGRDGFFMLGADANNGSLIGCDASSNGRINFNDSSFLGNGFAFCHSASPGRRAYGRGSDGQGYRCRVDHLATEDTIPVTGANWETYWELFSPITTYANIAAGTRYYDSRAGKTGTSPLYHYFSGNANSTSTFLSCYSEGTGESVYSNYAENDRKTFSGGSGMSVDYPNNRGLRINSPHVVTTYQSDDLPDTANRILTTVGGRGRFSAFSFRRYIASSAGIEWLMEYSPAAGQWNFGPSIASSRCFALMEADNTSGLPSGILNFAPQGVAIMSKVHTHLNAEPGTGTYRRGDRIYANNPTAGGAAGWVCITAGVAGSTAVFKPMANLGA